MLGWLVGLLADWLVGWLAGWLVGWLAGWLVGWLAGWLGGCVQTGWRFDIFIPSPIPPNFLSPNGWLYRYIYIYIFMYVYIYIYIYTYIEVWGKGVLNGKRSARGPRKMSEAIVD